MSGSSLPSRGAVPHLPEGVGVNTFACAVCLRSVLNEPACGECGEPRVVPVTTRFPADPWYDCTVTGPPIARAEMP